VPTPLLETATAAIAARLTAQVTTATVERSRRDPVDLDKETLPRLVLIVTSWEADETAEPLATHYTMAFSVTGYAKGRTALLADQATSTLHAATVAALMAWTPSESGLGEPAEEGADRRLLDTEESAAPVGEFVARFSMLCTAATGSPYSA
jgi:hypothetical protein